MITLATLKDVTAKEVFEQVKNHLLTQKARSTVKEVCVYRGENGLKCAAGCLMSDNEYKKNFENKRWQYLVEYNMVPNAHVQLIDSLQSLHDHYPVSIWEKELEQLRIDFNIE